MPDTKLSEQNRVWLFWTSTTILSIVMGIGGLVYQMQQKQIETNTSKIWQIQSTAVTEDKLDRQLSQMKVYIDVRMQSLESSQREMTRQLTILVADSKEAQSENRKALENIGQTLSFSRS